MIFDTEFNSAAQVPAQICVDAAALAEERGFGGVWKGESNSRDPLVLLSAYAARTTRLDLGTAIYHMYGRSPVTLGIQAATLNEYSRGRLLLGLGVGNEVIAAWHGDAYDRPLRRMREYIDILRATYSGERVEYEGEFYATTRGFKLAFEPPPYPLRVLLAALGPQMTRLAGRISDGVVINMADPASVRRIVERCHEGAREAGRDPAGFEVATKLRVALSEDAAQAKRNLKKVLTFYALQTGYSSMLREMGFSEDVDRIRNAYEQEGFRAARDQVSDDLFAGVPMFAGSSLDGLAERLDAYRDAGVTRMIVAFVPTGDDLWAEIRAFLESADFVSPPV
jgi:probable F420-dependent oxidoreductase